MRSGKTGLLGNTLNVDNMQWVRFDASIGAGTDSFYEYLLKVGVQLIHLSLPANACQGF